jgi:peptide/nickel transport system permease protein
MNQYLTRRLILVVPTLLGVSFLVFLVVRLQPGTAATIICGGTCTPEQERQINRDLGLDRPIPVQYVEWLGGVVQGDFGKSLLEHNSVADQLKNKAPVTLQLGAMGMIIAVLIAVPVGMISAVRQDTAIDHIARTVSVALIAVPSFWTAILLISAGSKYGFWTPELNYVPLTEDPIANFKIMWVPALLLGTALSGALMRLTRAQMLEVLREDYVRTAWAKGLSERTVLRRHAIRNAAIPVVTLVGLQVSVLVGGSVILETIFSIPGTGRYIVDAVRKNDLPVIQAVNLMVAAIVIVSNLVVDVVYTLIDPRVRASR